MVPTFTTPHADSLELLRAAIAEAMKTLLSTKHLYQKVSVDLTKLDDLAELRRKTKEKQQKDLPVVPGSVVNILAQTITGMTAKRALGGQLFVNHKWIPQALGQESGHIVGGNERDIDYYFSLPTINTHCTHCDQRHPFRPQASRNFCQLSTQTIENQWYLLAYECQNCQDESVRFLVRRKADELIICGRDPIENIEVDKVIPKMHSKHVRDGIIAHQCGQTLSGLFQLRVFIEQVWRKNEHVAAKLKGVDRPTGDQLSDAYNETLPDDFKSRFPLLGNVYRNLSAAIHEAKADAALFENSLAEIVKHFDAKRLYEL